MYYSHFTNEEKEAQGDRETCARSQQCVGVGMKVISACCQRLCSSGRDISRKGALSANRGRVMPLTEQDGSFFLRAGSQRILMTTLHSFSVLYDALHVFLC